MPIIFAISPKIAKKLEKSQFLLKLLNSRVKGGRRVPSKNCEKLEKSQFLLKLLNLFKNAISATCPNTTEVIRKHLFKKAIIKLSKTN